MSAMPGATVLSLDPLARARRAPLAASFLASKRPSQGPLPTAIPELDELLGGGLPRGRLVEIIGSVSSGRFALGLSTLSSATHSGLSAALVDLGDNLDPESARAFGVDLARLLWLRPTRLRDALAAAEMAIGGGLPLVVVDLAMPPLTSRGPRVPETAWVRLVRAAAVPETSVLVLSPYRVSGFAAEAVVRAEAGRAVWQGGGASPRVLAGLSGQLVLEKRRGAAGGVTRSFVLVSEERIAIERALEQPQPAQPQASPAHAETFGALAEAAAVRRSA